MSISDIDIRYRIPLVGCYNPAVIYECPYCDKQDLKEHFDHVCGFSEAPIGLVMISECPECHEKYYSHADKICYELFLDAVDDGTNIFFK